MTARAQPRRAWTKEAIQEMLAARDRAVERGLLAIYRLQTDQERGAQETLEHNGVGFNAFDAKAMTVQAQYLLRFGSLTPGRISLVRERLMKYAGQLARIANQKEYTSCKIQP